MGYGRGDREVVFLFFGGSEKRALANDIISEHEPVALSSRRAAQQLRTHHLMRGAKQLLAVSHHLGDQIAQIRARTNTRMHSHTQPLLTRS